jgi:endonuclease YncB( thermonuclease family)
MNAALRFLCAETAASVIAAALLLTTALAQKAPDKAPAACAPRDAVAASVKSVTDGRTLTLADNREVRLAAIEGVEPSAQTALSSLVTGRDITFSPLVPPKDRYGRLNMRAFIANGDATQSVEAALIAQGVALAAPRGDDDGCMALLLRAERTARAGKLGLWSDAARKILQAENPAALMTAQGKFAVVEGKVLSVRESGGTLYVNFGRRWSEDFTVTILKRNARKFTDAGAEPKSLERRNVRVRGFIEERGGPWIEAAIPEQIEIADGP